MILLLTAVPGLDYVPLDSIITFGACESRMCVNISIIDDQKVERAEYFHINLLRPPDLIEGVTFNNIYGQIWIYSQDSKNPSVVILNSFNLLLIHRGYSGNPAHIYWRG